MDTGTPGSLRASCEGAERHPNNLPYSIGHANLWPLRLYLQVFGLWQPSGRKWWWLAWRLLVFVAVHSYFLLFMSVAPWGQRDNPINAFFREHTRLPIKFSGVWPVLIPSVCANALPVACFLFSFAYVTAGHGFFASSLDVEVHLNRVIASVPTLESGAGVGVGVGVDVGGAGAAGAGGAGVGGAGGAGDDADGSGGGGGCGGATTESIFERRVRRRTAVIAAVHGLSALASAAVECRDVRWGLFCFLWVLLWSSPLPSAALILSVVCEVHELEFEAIARCIKHQSSLGRLWLICRNADARLRETGDKFRLYFVPPAVLILCSVVCLGVAAMADNGFRDAALGNSLWMIFYLAFFICIYTSSILAAVSVTESASRSVIRAVNDYQLPQSSSVNGTWSGALCEGAACSSAARTEAEHLKAYLQTLSSGFYIFGTRMDTVLLSRAAFLCVTFLSAVAQRMLGRL